MNPEQKYKLIMLVVCCIFITGRFYLTAMFTQQHIDAGEIILSLVNILAVLLSILGIEFTKKKE